MANIKNYPTKPFDPEQTFLAYDDPVSQQTVRVKGSELVEKVGRGDEIDSLSLQVEQANGAISQLGTASLMTNDTGGDTLRTAAAMNNETGGDTLRSAARQDTQRFPYVVGSVDDLAAAPAGFRIDGQAARISTTGRAGDFVFDSSDLSVEVAADTQRGIYVAPDGQDGSNGAWVRELGTSAVTPQMFGAVGDSVVDDKEAFQAAIDNGLGTVSIPDGNYFIGSPIVIDRDGLVLTGQSKTAVLIAAENAEYGITTGVIRVNSKNVQLGGFTVDGNATVAGDSEPDRSSCIYLNITSEDCIIRDVAAINALRHNICVLGSGHQLQNIYSKNARRYGVAFGDGSNVAPGVFNCSISGYFSEGDRDGIEVNDGAIGITVTDFQIINTTRNGMRLRDHGQDDEGVERVVVSNGVIENVQNTGIYIDVLGSQNNITDLVVSNVAIADYRDFGLLLLGRARRFSIQGLSVSTTQGGAEADVRLDFSSGNVDRGLLSNNLLCGATASKALAIGGAGSGNPIAAVGNVYFRSADDLPAGSAEAGNLNL